MKVTRPFLTAEWRNLVMLNYAVEPSLLEPFVPRGTVLDAWHADGCTPEVCDDELLLLAVAGSAIAGELAALYWPELATILSAPPTSAFLADGSPVVIHRPVVG